MAAAVLALVGLGLFQFLSRRSQREARAGADDADAKEARPRQRDHGQPAQGSGSTPEPR